MYIAVFWGLFDAAAWNRIANAWRSGSFLSFIQETSASFSPRPRESLSTPPHITSAQRRTSCCEPLSGRRDLSAMALLRPLLGVNGSSRKPATAAL